MITNLLKRKSLSEEQKKILFEQKPVILMGRGHSGTRVLSWACAKLGICLGTDEGLATGDADDQVFTQEIKKIAVDNVGITRVEQINQRDLDRFQNAVYGYYQRLGYPNVWWGWKFPETYLIAPYIEKTFPEAVYIHLVRDGRDISFKNHLTDDPKRKLGKKLLKLNDALELPHHLQAAISWEFQVKNFDYFCEAIPNNRKLSIRFEDICLKPFDEIERLCKFLNISFTDECERYLKEKINTKKISQYKENEASLISEVENKIGETLKKYRYI